MTFLTDIFRWFQKKPGENTEKVYSFIWYKQMDVNGKTFYTRPFRTKVTAPGLSAAIDKMRKFAMKKVVLVISLENEFDKTELGDLEKKFNDLEKEMNAMHEKMSNMFSKFPNNIRTNS